MDNKVQIGMINNQYFQIRDMNHEVQKHSLLLLELVSYVQLANIAVEHQAPAPKIIVAGQFTILHVKTTFQ